MNRFGFESPIFRVRDAFLIIGASAIATMIAPSLSTLAQLMTHTLSAAPAISWSRSWAGGILSVLIFTPLITTWLPWRRLPFARARRLEIALAFSALIAVTFFLFWTPYASGFGLSGIYVLLAVLVWIVLRLDPRNVTLSLLVTTVLAMAGTLIAHPTANPINQQLLSDELFIEFLAVIFLLFCSVIEERRIAKRSLEESVEQLEIALRKISREDKAKSEFIATLAHELRNPLAPVVSALELLKLGNTSRASGEIIASAEQQLQVMRRLLDDLLEVARLSQGSFKLQKEPVDISEIVRRSVETARHFMLQRSHTLTVEVPAEATLVEADPVRLQQIIVNLLNNAAKYTPAGGRIRLAAAREGSRMAIRVSDNGIGIPAESMRDIFEPFRQIRPTPQMGTGLGIGLSLTKRLVEMHGGEIEVESSGTDKGSTFTVYLPLATQTAPLKLIGMSAPVSEPVRSYSILIVDDNEAAAGALKKLLDFKGYQAHVASSGSAALERAQNFSPRVVLLDIGLPDIDGYEVARKLKTYTNNMTLIALSGYGQEEDKKRAKEAGFDYHLTKPAGIADIEAILAKA